MSIEPARETIHLRTERAEAGDQGGLPERDEITESTQPETLQQRDRLRIDRAMLAEHTDAEIGQQRRAATDLDHDGPTDASRVMRGHGCGQTTVCDPDAEDDVAARRFLDDALQSLR